MDYTPQQMKYIKSVGGAAHMSAVEIIGELDRALSELGGTKYFEEWHKQTFPEKYIDWSEEPRTIGRGFDRPREPESSRIGGDDNE